jgi:hypothetical protein
VKAEGNWIGLDWDGWMDGLIEMSGNGRLFWHMPREREREVIFLTESYWAGLGLWDQSLNAYIALCEWLYLFLL